MFLQVIDGTMRSASYKQRQTHVNPDYAHEERERNFTSFSIYIC